MAEADDGGSTGGAVERVRVVAAGDGSFYEVHVLVDTRDGTDPDAVADGFAPGGSAGGVSAQYALWRQWAASDMPVSVRYNGAAEPAGLNLPTYLPAAMTTWSSVSVQSFRFAWAGTGSGAYDTCGSTPADGVNTVLFGTFNDTHILAATCVVFSSGTGDVPRAREFDMLVSSSANWSVADTTPANAFDLPSTLLHELGHALGLDHTTATGAVMVATLAPGKRVRTLAADDVAGIRALYGTGPPPESDPAPTLKPLNFSLRFASMARDN
jgi:hypothetical protein